MAVQAEVDRNILDTPAAGDLHVLRQVIVAHAGDVTQAGNAYPSPDVVFAGVRPICAGLAANGVLMGYGAVKVHHLAVLAVLQQDAGGFAQVAEDVAGGVLRVLGEGGNGDKLVLLVHSLSHADPGFRLQAFRTNGNLDERRKDIIEGLAVI